jgi:hypothetical protein
MWNDVRFGARMLVKTPAFTIITGLALALGIGASTTTFSVVNALLLKPWPYIQDQERVLYVSEYFPKSAAIMTTASLIRTIWISNNRRRLSKVSARPASRR